MITDVCFQMDNPVVRDLVAELLQGEYPAAVVRRPKSRGTMSEPHGSSSPFGFPGLQTKEEIFVTQRK